MRLRPGAWKILPPPRAGFTAAPRRWRPAAALSGLLVAAAAVLAGCGGSEPAKRSDAASAPAATVTTEHLAGYGTVLATSAGQALYVLTADPPGGSRCVGSCTTKWHPLTASGAPTAGRGVKQSLLSTFRRSDGSEQLVYNNHALYTYSGYGQSGGAGITAYGGIWYLVSPSGKAIEQTTSGGY
jgi:predicted lipoprotein with Yx(FWY)xxD motif